jgi:hypothetical protein
MSGAAGTPMRERRVPAFALMAMRQHRYSAADLVRNARPSSNGVPDRSRSTGRHLAVCGTMVGYT